MAVLILQPSGQRIGHSLFGHVYHSSGNYGTGLSWAEQIVADGNLAGSAISDPLVAYNSQGSPEDTWRALYRIICLFDLTGVPTSQDIDSAQIKAVGEDKLDQVGESAPDINIYLSNPTSTSELTVTDYSTFGSTPYCDTPIGFNDWLVGGWNTFELNAAGLIAVLAAREGIFKAGFRNANYDVAEIAPDWPSSALIYLERHDPLLGLAFAQGQIIG